MRAIDQMTPEVRKAELKKRKISYNEIAEQLSISKAAISAILDNIYDGAEDTKQRVLNYIEALIMDRLDMNVFIYNYQVIFLKMTEDSINNKRYTLDEKVVILKFYEDLKKLKIIKS